MTTSHPPSGGFRTYFRYHFLTSYVFDFRSIIIFLSINSPETQMLNCVSVMAIPHRFFLEPMPLRPSPRHHWACSMLNGVSWWAKCIGRVTNLKKLWCPFNWRLGGGAAFFILSAFFHFFTPFFIFLYNFFRYITTHYNHFLILPLSMSSVHLNPERKLLREVVDSLHPRLFPPPFIVSEHACVFE